MIPGTSPKSYAVSRCVISVRLQLHLPHPSPLVSKKEAGYICTCQYCLDSQGSRGPIPGKQQLLSTNDACPCLRTCLVAGCGLSYVPTCSRCLRLELIRRKSRRWHVNKLTEAPSDAQGHVMRALRGSLGLRACRCIPHWERAAFHTNVRADAHQQPFYICRSR